MKRKVVVKRRYTEAYPAKNISTNARVRSVISRCYIGWPYYRRRNESQNTYMNLQAHKRWLKRNLSLFNISEDQEGIKTYALSPYGQRVKERTLPKVLK